MKKSLAILALLIMALCFQGCFASIQGSGRIIQDERAITADFNGVRVSNHGDLAVSLGDRVKLVVEGDDNIVPRIVTRVSGDTLVIENDRDFRYGWSSRKGIRYHLTVRKGQLNRLELTSHGDAEVPEITGPGAEVRLTSHGDIRIGRIETDDFSLEVTSHGDVKIERIKADSLKVRMTSHGDIRLVSGEVGEQDISLTSHGDYLAAGVRSLDCRVRNSSHGTIRVWAEKSLSARLSSHGRLYYKGDPAIDASRESRKKMRRRD